MLARITDRADPRLAPYRLVAEPDALRREGLFVAEGRLVLPQLLASAYRAHSVLVSDAALDALRPQLDGHPGLDVMVANADLLSEIGGHDFHRGCLALAYREPPRSLTSHLDAGSVVDPVLLLEGVSNPDNIGVIFRAALAFGAGVMLGPGCADPLYRKSIRTSMGATLHARWSLADDWLADLARVRSAGYTLLALTPRAAAVPLREAVAQATGPIGFVLGSEGYGLSDEALDAASQLARIPILPAVDSLNVATAASIALYELSRASSRA
jgi:tRNA G18 (ribose-2'-O)-methylase SpoU